GHVPPPWRLPPPWRAGFAENRGLTRPRRAEHTVGANCAPLARGSDMSRILLVEDEQVNREMFRRRLTGRGVDVLTPAAGAGALAPAGRRAGVLMALGLPGSDGGEAPRRLRAARAPAAIPVIALSAPATADAKERAFAAGCVEFETKPVQLDRLVEKIHAALAKAAPPPAAPARQGHDPVEHAPTPRTLPPPGPDPHPKTPALPQSRPPPPPP